MTRLVLSVVLTLVATAALPAAAPAEKLDLRGWAKQMQARHAYGMYMGGKKAGFAIEEVKLGKYDGKEVLTVTSHQQLVTIYDGEKSTKDERTLFHYELTGQGTIVYARLTRKEDGKSAVLELTRRDKGMRIITRQNGRTLRRDVGVPKDTLANLRALQAWLAGDRKKGDTFVKYSLSWEDAEIDQKETYHFKKKASAKVDGAERTAYQVDIDINGGKLVSEVFPDGRPINGTLGGLLTLKLEKEAEARKVEGAPADLMDTSSVPIDMDLGRARLVDELKLEITNLGDFQIPASHRQVVAKEKGVVLLTVKRDFRVEKAAPLTKAEREANLRSTPRLQCDHRSIVAQAKKIVGEEADALKKAKLIGKWVFETLKKSYSDNADTALEVLDNKAGDCTEHSLIFVALARAAGLPAREVGGLAYVKANDKPMMGWHAWAEVHDGHQWVSFDPTWDEAYVDGTHVKLSEGEKDLAWANVAGKIKIKVREVSKRK